MSSEYKVIDLKDLKESKLNPRQTFDAAYLAELAASITSKGVLVPVIVRQTGDTSFELVAGACRYRAAQAAGLAQIPAIIRTLTDQETLEIMVIENSQRKDVHPLEEAMGYRALMATYKNHGEKAVDIIAGKVGMSVKYVYDRVKLCALIPEAQKIFLADRITAGHAILLARLSAADQKRCIDPERANQGREGGLWTGESTLFDPDDDHDAARADKYDELKAVSVRELAGWIDEHVKFDKQAVEPMLFPETAAVLHKAAAAAAKVINITHEHFVQPDAKDGKERIFGPKSWTRADGRHGSKPCEHSVIGVIVAGPGRGQAFDVCTDKHACTVHYGKEIKERAQREQANADRCDNPGIRQMDKATLAAREREKEQEKEKREEAERARWIKARPSILKALAAAVTKAPTKAGGLLGQILIKHITPWRCEEKPGAYVPPGTTAEDLLRHAAFIILAEEACEYDATEAFPARMKAFGLDAKKILDQAAPPTKQAEALKPKPAPAKSKKKLKKAA